MSKKKQQKSLKPDLEKIGDRCGEIRDQIAELQQEDKDLKAILKAHQAEGETVTYGRVKIEMRRNRRFNLGRAFQVLGKKATERVPTRAAVDRLGLPEDAMDSFYDVGEPAVYITILDKAN